VVAVDINWCGCIAAMFGGGIELDRDLGFGIGGRKRPGLWESLVQLSNGTMGWDEILISAVL